VPAVAWVIFALALLVVGGMASRWLMDNDRNDPAWGVGLILVGLYTKFYHGLTVRGRENLPPQGGPLIVVINHTAGVDPILVQLSLPFEVRWMMAKDMMLPDLSATWKWLRVIPVDRDAGDSSALREALRHLKAGGVVGIYPEGRIEKPPRHVMPFAPGVGLLVKKSGAPVLPVLIEGTPQTQTAWGSLTLPSRSRVTIGPPVRYDRTKMSAADIAEDLRRRYLDWTGWPPSPLIATA
jgi:1-acyl-sn-glycerol-3-phosphate acyltransferase